MATKTTTPVSQKRSGNPTGCLVLFGLIFLLAGLGAFFFTFLTPLLQIQAAQNWKPVAATIISSSVGSNRDSDGDTTYRVEVQYSFPFNGQTYYGNTYQFGANGSSNATEKNAIVAKLPPGTKITCYVNPANPNQSVINPSMNRDLWPGLFSLIFVAVGAGIIIAGIKSGKSGAVRAGAQSWQPKSTMGSGAMGSGGAVERMPQSAIPTAAGGPVTLKPRTTRFGGFCGLLVFSVFWNGIVGVFLASAFFGKSGSFPIFMWLFLTPFILVGIIMIGATFHQFLAMFGPKVELTVSQAQVPLGSSININWKLSGRQNVTKFQIFLEGREEATYRRGTDTYTDKNTFCVLDVTNTLSSVTQGDATVQIPIATMHSFEARNNKILWQLVVKGEIPIWPDIKDEYPIVVLPVNFS